MVAPGLVPSEDHRRAIVGAPAEPDRRDGETADARFANPATDGLAVHNGDRPGGDRTPSDLIR